MTCAHPVGNRCWPVMLQGALLLALLEARSVAALEITGQELVTVFVDRVRAGTE